MRKAAAFITITIPRAENQVRTQAISLPRASRQPNALAGLQQGLETASNTINQIAAKEAAEQDASRIKKASTDYELARNRFLYGSTDEQGNQIPGLMNTVGEAAVNPEDGITLDRKLRDWHKEYKEKVMPTLGNERQRTMLAEQIDGSYPSAEAAVMKHEYTQGQAVKLGNAKASTEIATDNAIALGTNPAADPTLYADAQKKIREAVEVQALLEGYGPKSEYAKNLLDTKMSKLHTNIIITKISRDDDQGALEYFNEHQAEITDPEMKRQIGATIKTIEIRVAGKGIAESAWNDMKPEDVNGYIDLAGMREKIRSGKESDEVKEIAIKRAEELASEYQQAKRLKQEEVSNRIYGMPGQGSTYDQVIKKIDLNTDIDNVAKESLRTWADSKFKIGEQRTEKKGEEKIQQALDRIVKLQAFQERYLAGDYGILTPDAVSKMVGDFGEFTDNAITFTQKVNANLETAKVTDADLKDFIYVLGQNDQYKDLVPNLDKPSPEDKAKFAMLQGKVMQIMVDSQKAEGPGKGKTLKAATLEALTAVKTDNHSGFLWLGSTTDPYYLVGTDLASGKAKGDPSTWSREAQDNYLTARWKLLPSNNGKTLTPQELEKMRSLLLKSGE